MAKCKNKLIIHLMKELNVQSAFQVSRISMFTLQKNLLHCYCKKSVFYKSFRQSCIDNLKGPYLVYTNFEIFPQIFWYFGGYLRYLETKPCVLFSIFLRQYSVLCLKQSSSTISTWKMNSNYIISDHYKQTRFSKIEDADHSKTP